MITGVPLKETFLKPAYSISAEFASIIPQQSHETYHQKAVDIKKDVCSVVIEATSVALADELKSVEEL